MDGVECLQLTWIRRRDWHILTHGAVTFTTDDRFQLVKEELVDDWVLQIKHVVARDTGSYECQVSNGCILWVLADWETTVSWMDFKNTP